MALSDLGHCFCDAAVEEGRPALKVGRADNDVAVGDLIEMLLSKSFACKDGMLDWSGSEFILWNSPAKRLDCEIYRIEHLAFASYMESSMTGWLREPWHIGFAALRNMAVLDWTTQHMYPVCGASGRNRKSSSVYPVSGYRQCHEPGKSKEEIHHGAMREHGLTICCILTSCVRSTWLCVGLTPDCANLPEEAL